MRQKLILTIGILVLLASLCFGVWDPDKPADNDQWNDAAGFIRDNWDALEVALGVDLDGTGNLLPWTGATSLTTSGSGTSGDPWIISDPSAFNNVYFYIAGYYQLSANWNIISDSHIWGTKGVFLEPAGFTLECSGTVSGTTSDLTADSAKGSVTVDVANGSLFSTGDWIEISASQDIYIEYAAKTLPRELNRVVSISTNTITVKYPVRRFYDYDAGQSDKPTVTLITTVKENVVVENINIEGDIDFGYVNNLAIHGITVERLTFSEVVRFFEITNIEAVLPLAGDDNKSIFLEGATEGVISVRTYGGGNGILLFGCADIRGDITVKQCHYRAVWIYGSEDIHLSPVNVTGTRTNAINFEILVFDFSGSCSIRNAFVKEINKTGESQIVEFRNNLGLCEFTDSEVFCYSTSVIVIKPESRYTVIDRNIFHLVNGVTSVVDVKQGSIDFADTFIGIRNNQIINNGDTGNLIRTSSNIEFTTQNFNYVDISYNKMSVVIGEFLISIRAKDGFGGKGIDTLRMVGNVVEILSAGDSGFYRAGDLDFPITTLIFDGNVETGLVGQAPNFRNVTNIKFGSGNFHAVPTGSPQLFNLPSPAQIGELSNDATPSIKGNTRWKTAGTIAITRFDNGVAGQEIIILSDHSIKITDNANIILTGSIDFDMTATDTLSLIQRADGNMYETGRGDNGT